MTTSTTARNYPCFCCGFWTLTDPANGSYEVCPVCFWEDDPVQNEDPLYEGGANGVSLTAARRNYVEFGACDREFASNVRPPKTSEIPLFLSSVECYQPAFERGIKDAVVAVARSILSGQTGAIDGCRAIAAFAQNLERGSLSEALSLFEAVASETDEFPAGVVRELWHPKALAAIDARRATYEAQVSPAVLQACGSLLARVHGD